MGVNDSSLPNTMITSASEEFLCTPHDVCKLMQASGFEVELLAGSSATRNGISCVAVLQRQGFRGSGLIQDSRLKSQMRVMESGHDRAKVHLLQDAARSALTFALAFNLAGSFHKLGDPTIDPQTL